MFRRRYVQKRTAGNIKPVSYTHLALSISVSSHARIRAGIQLAGSRPFSKRADESVRIPSSFAVIRTDGP